MKWLVVQVPLLNLLSTWREKKLVKEVRNQESTHCKAGSKAHPARRGFLSRVGPTGSNSRQIAQHWLIIYLLLQQLSLWSGGEVYQQRVGQWKSNLNKHVWASTHCAIVAPSSPRIVGRITRAPIFNGIKQSINAHRFHPKYPSLSTIVREKMWQQQFKNARLIALHCNSIHDLEIVLWLAMIFNVHRIRDPTKVSSN